MTGDRIPLTVLGGYLGAGKTTLLNRVLRGDHGLRVAVIVNDFGDVVIDEALIESEDGNVRALANGCICCAAVDGLAMALDELGALDPAPEHLVIEVSGVGDPWAVAQWGRTPGYELEAVLVVVDPESIGSWLDDRYVGDTVTAQVRAADMVVLSRTDVAAPAVVDAARERVATLTDAPVADGPSAGVDLLVPIERLGRPAAAGHGAHVSLTVTPSPSDREGLRRWLDSAPAEIVRVKGLVPGADEVLVAQRSGRRVEVTRHRGASPVVPAVTVIARPGTDPSVLERWVAPIRD